MVLGFDPGATIGWAELSGGAFLRGGDTRDLRDALLLIQTLASIRDPALVVVESVKQVYPRERFTSKMATALLLAERQAGELVATARSCGLDVLEVSAAQWRKAIVGGKAPSDAAIKKVLSRVVVDFPAKSNAHVRDAMGCALFGERWSKLQSRRRKVT